MTQLYVYENKIRTMGEMQAIWFIECISVSKNILKHGYTNKKN